MLKDGMKLEGKLIIKKHDLTTNEVSKSIYKNRVVLNGRNLIRDFLAGDTVSGLNYFAVGTDTTDPTVEPTITEVFRNQITSIVKASSKLTVDLYLSSQDANGNTLTSAALFGNEATNTSGSGTQYNKVVYDPITKDESQAITYTWELTFSAT